MDHIKDWFEGPVVEDYNPHRTVKLRVWFFWASWKFPLRVLGPVNQPITAFVFGGKHVTCCDSIPCCTQIFERISPKWVVWTNWTPFQLSQKWLGRKLPRYALVICGPVFALVSCANFGPPKGNKITIIGHVKWRWNSGTHQFSAIPCNTLR